MLERTHETVSFATFLEYRARRLHAPMVEPPPDREHVPTTLPEPGPTIVAMAVPRPKRV